MITDQYCISVILRLVFQKFCCYIKTSYNCDHYRFSNYDYNTNRQNILVKDK
jgi:hypothetical protein